MTHSLQALGTISDDSSSFFLLLLLLVVGVFSCNALGASVAVCVMEFALVLLSPTNCSGLAATDTDTDTGTDSLPFRQATTALCICVAPAAAIPGGSVGPLQAEGTRPESTTLLSAWLPAGSWS
ncbi:hypothetical protein WR25_23225 [Diploscapter pachys]|uniref:Uncharacterized protein n=1 Tax=Diploscapter pachys TaxID=2018661 RepID=A0A2A2JK04_9BILA|nr:hypothetical protein WR25_23225 [Diploscapter pachys]